MPKSMIFSELIFGRATRTFITLKFTHLEAVLVEEFEKRIFQSYISQRRRDRSIALKMNVFKKMSPFFVFHEFHHENKVFFKK